MSENKPPIFKDALISGVIAAVVGVGATMALSLGIPFPWSLGQTSVSVAIASFFGAAIGFMAGQRVRGESNP